MANPFRPTTNFFPFFSRVLIDGQIWDMEAGENKRIASFATLDGKGSVIPFFFPLSARQNATPSPDAGSDFLQNGR